MSMQTFGLSAARVGKFKGEILAHAVPYESLARDGRQVKLPKNSSDTYIARRYLPYGATSTSGTTQNRFFADANGDRTASVIQAHQTQEGVTPTPDSLTPVDVTVVVQQYSCLYGFTDKTAMLYEDDIPAQMKIQNGERMTYVNEQIIYGALKACTNAYFGGGGTTVATVAGKLTLGLLRKIAVNLVGNHAKPVNKRLSASANYGTEAVFDSFNVYVHSDVEPDIRDLANFTPVEKYGSGKPMPNEIGKCERFRFMIHPDLPSIQNGGAAVGATGLKSTSGSNIDVYPIIVTAQDAWSQVAIRGANAMDVTFIPVGSKSSADPFGQRGYAGAIWWKAVLIENHGWMAVCNVGITNLA